MNPLNLIILGPQGSGKGTQAQLLAEKFDLVLLGAGDLLREIARTDSDLGREVHETINVEGRLVRPEVISEVFRLRLSDVPKDKGVILESYPRSRGQYEQLKKFWPDLSRDGYRAIFIDLPKEQTVARLSRRLTCESCGRVYIAGQVGDTCPNCGGKLIQRIDDRPEVIRNRLATFEAETMPVVDELEREGRLVRINGNQSIESVHEEISKKLNL